jgi:predicted ester cyclase
METEMSQLERNKKLIFSQHREIWSRSDPEAVDRYYAPEVTLHFAGRGVTGRSGIKALIEARRKAFADWHEEVEMVIAEGDFVSSRVTSTATHTGPFLGIKASNRRIQVAEMFLFRVQSDLIAECWGELDMLGLLSQIRPS